MGTFGTKVRARDTFVAAAASVALAGCSGLPQREAYLNSLVGQPEVEVVRQLGVPARTVDAEGRTFLAYDTRRVEIYSGGPYLGGPPFGPFGYPYAGYAGYAFSPDVVEWQCETTFEVANGRVQSWSLRGNACGSLGPEAHPYAGSAGAAPPKTL